jgi:hypothetical protein
MIRPRLGFPSDVFIDGFALAAAGICAAFNPWIAPFYCAVCENGELHPSARLV